MALTLMDLDTYRNPLVYVATDYQSDLTTQEKEELHNL
jgi:hypothetical protein